MKKILALLFTITASTMLYAQCFSYIQENTVLFSHKFVKDTKSCFSGQVLDVRIWNNVDSENHIDDSLINFQTKYCDYGKQITQHKNKIFKGVTCVKR